MNDTPDTSPQNALERLFRRTGVVPTPDRLRRDAALCVFYALGVVDTMRAVRGHGHISKTGGLCVPIVPQSQRAAQWRRIARLVAETVRTDDAVVTGFGAVVIALRPHYPCGEKDTN